MFPAIIRVTPKSPMARAEERASPTARERRARGRVMRRKISRSLRPRVRAASSSRRSTRAKPERAEAIIRGRAGTMAPITAAGRANRMPASRRPGVRARRSRR